MAFSPGEEPLPLDSREGLRGLNLHPPAPRTGHQRCSGAAAGDTGRRPWSNFWHRSPALIPDLQTWSIQTTIYASARPHNDEGRVPAPDLATRAFSQSKRERGKAPSGALRRPLVLYANGCFAVSFAASTSFILGSPVIARRMAIFVAS